jgi:hypothetical protein
MKGGVVIPVRTVSESNARDHHRARARRVRQQRGLARLLVSAGFTRPALPLAEAPAVVVTLTRIAPRDLDDDNLRGALKAIRDGIADWLGVTDRNPRVVWRYGQERGAVRFYAVRVDVAAA